MGVDPEEAADIHDALSSPQGASRAEVAAFNAILAQTPTEIIVKRLDDNVIARAWKRDLAEAEVARREASPISRSTKRSGKGSPHHNSAVLKSWAISIVLILLALAFVAVQLM